MSDRLNWIPISVWAAAVGVQIGTAIYDYWKRGNGQIPPTGYEKVLQGETVNGWRLANFNDKFREMCNQCDEAYYACPLDPACEADVLRSVLADDTTMLVNHVHRLSNDHQVISLSRFSLVAPGVSTTLFKIVCGNNWRFKWTGHMSERTVVTVFRERTGLSGQYRFVFIDLVSKSHRIVTVESRIGSIENQAETQIYMVYQGDAKKRYLSVVFTSLSTDDQDIDAPWRRDFYEMRYELPPSNNGLQPSLRASTWQMISIPIHLDLEVIWTDYCLYPQLAILYDDNHSADLERHRCFLYDQNGNWRMESLASWLSSFRATSYGSKLINAAEALGALSPPDDYKWIDIPPLRYSCGVVIGGVLYRMTNGNVLQRTVYPPSLKRLAAEAFCRANKGFNFAELKRAIGFDIFGGIFDEGDSPVIYF